MGDRPPPGQSEGLTKGVGISAKGVSERHAEEHQRQGLGHRPENRTRQPLDGGELQLLRQLPLSQRPAGANSASTAASCCCSSIIPRSARTRPTTSGTPAGWKTPTTTWSRKTTSPITSNTCLSLFTACRNRVLKNNLSYGIRIGPGETHARDSACVLVAGRLGRQLLRRQRHHLRRRRRLSPSQPRRLGQQRQRLRAERHLVCQQQLHRGPMPPQHLPPQQGQPRQPRHLGGLVERDDRRGQRGLLQRFAQRASTTPPGDSSSCPSGPQSGAAGIIMAGMCNHTICRGNKCIGNNGCGICLFGDDSPEHKFTAFHWVLENNIIKDNRWGIYMEFADWIDMAGNVIEEQPRRQHHRGGHAYEHLSCTRTIRKSAGRPRSSWRRRPRRLPASRCRQSWASRWCSTPRAAPIPAATRSPSAGTSPTGRRPPGPA